MGRRIKLPNPPRFELPKAVCVVAGCTDEPQPDRVICFVHARALANLATKETDR